MQRNKSKMLSGISATWFIVPGVEYINGLVQNFSISSVLALEILQSLP